MQIVGLGTGRCGTTSLATLIARQPGWDCVHERKPFLSWDVLDSLPSDVHFEHESRRKADVGFYYLPHVHWLLETYDGMQFVCLRRDRQQTIDSFCRVRPTGTNWFSSSPLKPDRWDRAFPNYDGLPFAEAVGAYWDMYYDVAGEYARQWPERFHIFHTEDLNDPAEVERLLRFAGVEDPNVVTHLHANRSQQPAAC